MLADRCRGWAWVALLLSFPVWAFCGGFCGFCGVSRRLLGVSGIFVGLAASAALAALGVALGLLILGGVVPSSGRVLAVDRLGGWAWFLSFCGGAVTVSGAVPWVLGLSSFRGAVTGMCGVSCGGLFSLSRGLSCGRLVGVLAGVVAGRGSVGVVGLTGLCGLPGLSGGHKKTGALCSGFAFNWGVGKMLVGCPPMV